MTSYKIMGEFFKLKRVVNLKMVNSLKSLRFGPKQAVVLVCATKYGSISSAKLADLTLSDPAAISRSIDILAKHGLMRRKVSSTYRRTWQLILTREGKQAAGKVKEILNSVAKDVFGILSLSEQKYLVSLLSRLIENTVGDNIKKGD